MNILGIETSCDETAAAIVCDGTDVLSNIVATSSQLHSASGGIIPEIAARQQMKYIIPVIDESLKIGLGINIKNNYMELKNHIDYIAVTIGPGLVGSLLVGIETAKTISHLTKIPIIPVNHMVGHLYANWLVDQSVQTSQNTTPDFPLVALVVSGGHTDIIYMRDHGNIKYVGGTRDDAAGEAFDKTARILGLPYPGGPAISKAAESILLSQKNDLKLFPRPMLYSRSPDFSFSGLKTSVYNYVNTYNNLESKKNLLAAEIQEAIVDVLVKKSINTLNKYKPKSFLLAGGVAANKRLREKMLFQIKKNRTKPTLFIPPVKYCTDNASYIASAAYFNKNTVNWMDINANPQLTIVDAL